MVENLPPGFAQKWQPRTNEELERLVAESAARLRESEEVNRTIIGSSRDCIKVLDLEGRLLFIVESGQKLLCIEDIHPYLGKPWCDFWKGKDREAALSAVRAAAAGGTGNFMGLFETLAGEPKWWDVLVTPILDAEGKPEKLLAVSRDVTDRHRTERALRASEEQLAAELAAMRHLQEISTLLIQEGNVDALYRRILDAAVGLMRSHMASMQMLDPDRSELRLLAWQGFHPRSAAYWERIRIDERGDSGSTCGAAGGRGERVIVSDIETCDFIVGTPDLDEFRRSGIRSCQSTPLISRSGRLLGVISTHWREPHCPADSDLRLFDVLARQAADLIERTQAEAALRDANASLEARVAERTRELEAAMEERRKAEAALHHARRLEAIGQLTGGVAHDFNNLLTVVSGHAERIVTAAGGNDEIASMAAAIQRAAERGARLTGQLLAFSRRQNLRTAVVTADRLLADIDDLIRRATGETIEVACSAAPDLWPMLVDPAQFESSLLNLVVNARDAMPNGGRLAVTARNVLVGEHDAARLELVPGDYVMVTVADAGVGMPPEVREHAFEPFFTTNDVGKGTGLGLAQVYGFVKQSGGAVTIDSAPGLGTTVSLYLPRARDDAVAADAQAGEKAAPLDGRGKTILVVEDQPDVRDVIELSLTTAGYRVLTAIDGVAAKELLAGGEAIDLLLTDVVMPNGVNGIDLAQSARQLRRNLKVVIVSGFPRCRADAISRQFVFLEKPFRHTELAEAVAAALHGPE